MIHINMPPMPSQPPRKPGAITRKYLVTSAFLAVVAVLLIVGAGLGRGHGRPPAADAAQAVDPQTECIRSWNSTNRNRQEIAGLATVGQYREHPTAYVHIGRSDTFPDLCLVTVANAVTLYAQQYLQSPGGGWTLAPAWSGPASQLPADTVRWNARIGVGGLIRVA